MVKCIIVDDEQPARELIAFHLSTLSDFELMAAFDNAIDAFSFLQKHPVDLVFLDIRMPRISGLELIRSLKQLPKIILTTAYREYAVEAFELDVLDYLVKPITQERFIKAISRFNYYSAMAPQKTSLPDSFETAYLFLRINREQVKVFLKDILYVEGFKDYIKVHTTSKILITYERLSYIEERLPESKFIRIHKSYIAAIDKIRGYSNEEVSIAETTLPVGRVYKNLFLKRLRPPGNGSI